MPHARRSHRKSRLGCVKCKKRRIKCDEQRPACKNCLNHEIQCEYSTSPLPAAAPRKSNSPETPIPSIALSPVASASSSSYEPRVPKLFTDQELTQMRLIHHFTTSTFQTLASTRDVLSLWRLHVPKVAFEHQFLLQIILAVSALHTHREAQSGSQSSLAYAQKAYYTSLEQCFPALSQISSANCEALYAFSLLALIFELGTLHTRTSLVFDSDGSLASWIVHTRGIRTVLDSSWHDIASGVFKPMLQCNFLATSPANMETGLDEFIRYIQEECSAGTIQVYQQTVLELLKWSRMAGHGFYGWLCHFSDDYGECLARKDPYALVIFGYACVNLKYEEPAYWVRGCAERLIRETYELVNTSLRTWLHWPMSEFGLAW